MDYRFTPQADQLKPSEIREILKLSAVPGIIPFSAGNPSNEAFPEKEIAAAAADVLTNNAFDALQYSITEGYPLLRQYVAEYMKSKYGVGGDDDDCLITAGAQQVMSLASEALAGDGDVILCESPSFIGSLNALRLTGARLVGLPMHVDGIEPDDLRAALEKEKTARALYIIPNFQNPTGYTTSLEKRKAIYALAREYDIIIIEDNPYGDLYFDQAPPASIKSMDTDGRVIYAGSFSKVISPGLRVGYAIANKALIAKMVALKQTQDVHAVALSQMIAYHIMKDHDFEAHLTRLRALYAKKAALCYDEFQKNLAPDMHMEKPQGGLFGWVKMPDGVDIKEFAMRALKEFSVAVVPGTAFNVCRTDDSRFIRINYSTPTDDQIRKGMAQLKQLKDKMLGEAK